MQETHLRLGRQTVKLGLVKVVRELFPRDNLKTTYSILEGVFCNLTDSALSAREVDLIGVKLKEWVDKKSPIELIKKSEGYYHYKLDDSIIKTVYPAHSNASMVDPFTIVPYSYGFIVDFGDIGRGASRPLIPPDMLSQAFEKDRRWLKNINIELVSDVNKYILAGKSMKLLSIAEALHEKEISDIADLVLNQRRALRVLLVSGPSSSGKTSFAQRISTQLEVNGFKPVPLSLDDYFLDREKTPLNEKGEVDLECIGAIDLELLNEHIISLIEGRKVETPIFDFVTGKRKPETKPIQIGPSDILVIEGIHALNPELITGINRNLLYKVYVSALGGLNIDLINRIPTTEIRLIRRMVRDDLFRGAAPEETLKRWTNVRASEYANIFLYQEEADVMFNSSTIYELNALRLFAEESLQKIKKDGPYSETKERLLNLLSFFEPIDTSKIPYNSILREFIGNSIYF